jgi:hypothetical protein
MIKMKSKLPILAILIILLAIVVVNVAAEKIDQPPEPEKVQPQLVRKQAEDEKRETGSTVSVMEEKRVRLFGVIPVRMTVEKQVNAETGAVIEEDEPWWSGLATAMRVPEEDTGMLAAEAPGEEEMLVAAMPEEDECPECEECEIVYRYYDCPHVVEYGFSDNIKQYYKMGFGGIAILRLEDAKIVNDELVCDYETTFERPNIDSTYDFFGIIYMTGDSCAEDCPPSVALVVRDETDIDGWTNSDYIRIPKGVEGHTMMIYNAVEHPDINCAFTYCGCEYERTLQSGEDPNLYMAEDGVCKVNDENDGFICADTIVELYGKEGDAVAAVQTS